MNKAEIRALLLRNDFAVERAMVVLYRRQTDDERASHSTKHTNGRGFNYTDAERGTKLAERILSGRHIGLNDLTWARQKACYYIRQLVEEAEIKAQKKAENNPIQP